MEYLKQVIYELKNHKMITWVSISGTALAIFLVMALFTGERIKMIEKSPESNRSRILKGAGIDVESPNSSGSSMGVSKNYIDRLYDQLDGIELTSLVNQWYSNAEASGDTQELINVTTTKVDENFWKIYDFKFIDGRPYTKEENDANEKIAIITENTARKLFGDKMAAGKTFSLDYVPYRVIGVVENIYPLLENGGKDIFLPLEISASQDNSAWGAYNILLLMKEGVSADYIKSQVEKRFEQLNAEMEKENSKFIYHQQPYTLEDRTSGSFGSNNDPRTYINTRIRWITYSILIILPAINLSSMTRSRLRRRISEIGVRRAFGAKKMNIITQIFTENFIITLAGGVIGFIVSVLFILTISEFFILEMHELTSSMLESSTLSPVLAEMFDWRGFGFSVAICFILNVLSATVPAWQASMIVPASAISKSH